MTDDDDTKKTGARKMLRQDQVLELVPIGRSTLDRMVKNGRFPAAHYISPNKKIWYEDEIRSWQGDLPARSQRKRRRKASEG